MRVRKSQNQRACFKYFISACVGKAYRERGRRPHFLPSPFFPPFIPTPPIKFGTYKRGKRPGRRRGRYRRRCRRSPIGRNLAKKRRTRSRSPFMSYFILSTDTSIRKMISRWCTCRRRMYRVRAVKFNASCVYSVEFSKVKVRGRVVKVCFLQLESRFYFFAY